MEGGRPSERIKFTPKDVEPVRVVLDGALYSEGRLFASQTWINKGDMRKAYEYVKGNDTYGEKQKPLIYEFTDAEGRVCYLVGDSQHRTAVGLLEGKPITATVDQNLGVVEEELMGNPNLAAQRYAILGIDGIWPFKVFMEKFVEAKINMGAKGK